MRDNEIAQIWVCDGLSASGSPGKLQEWYQRLKERGKEYGYIPKPGKCHIISKDPSVPLIFKEEIQRGELCISEGTRYLGAPIGTGEFKNRYLKEKVREHIKKLQKLSLLAKTSPHAAYFIHQTCTQHELTYIQRTQNLEKYVTEIESERKKLVEALFDNKIHNQNKWKEISLPTRHGGLGINVSSLNEDSNTQYRK